MCVGLTIDGVSACPKPEKVCTEYETDKPSCTKFVKRTVCTNNECSTEEMKQDCDEWDNTDPVLPFVYPPGCATWYDGCNHHSLDLTGNVMSISMKVCPDIKAALSGGTSW
jgi:Tfp pilus assembly protein PilX